MLLKFKELVLAAGVRKAVLERMIKVLVDVAGLRLTVFVRRNWPWRNAQGATTEAAEMIDINTAELKIFQIISPIGIELMLAIVTFRPIERLPNLNATNGIGQKKRLALRARGPVRRPVVRENASCLEWLIAQP